MMKQLSSLEGFTNAFWEEYRRSGDTQRTVFERLNDAYREEFGVVRFVSYGAFRNARDRATKRLVQKCTNSEG